MPKVLEFCFNISPSSEHPGLKYYSAIKKKKELNYATCKNMDGLAGSHAYRIIQTHRPMLLVATSLSHAQLFATPGTAARQTPLSMGFSRQEYWSGFLFSFSRGSSRPRDRTRVSCTGWWILYHLSHEGSPAVTPRVDTKSGCLGGPCRCWASLLPACRVSQKRRGMCAENILRMAAHSCILAWRSPTDRGAWQGYSPRGRRESDAAETR